MKFRNIAYRLAGVRWLTAWITLFAFIFAPGFIRAQEFRATITGQVNDLSGAAIPGATVTAVKADTGVATKATTDTAGVFSVQYLLPGTYTVSIEVKGFQKTNYTNVTLASLQAFTLNVTLKPETLQQEITVTAGAAGLLDTETASTGGVMDQPKVEFMATGFENPFDQFLWLQGVRDVTHQEEENSTLRAGGAIPSYSVDGAPGGDNQFYINGAPVSQQGTAFLKPSQDAIAELQASTAPYDAQYGWQTGGSFNGNIKSGTNHFHGDLYEYFGSKALNSNTPANNVTGLPKGPDTTNRYGGTVGGPIWKNKTFFFGSFDGWRQAQPQSGFESLPTTAMRQGNFAGSGYTIYDPATVTCAQQSSTGCNTYTRQAFPNDAIPGSRLNPIGQAIVNLYPTPTLSGALNNYVWDGPRNLGYDQYMARVDHNLSEKTRLYGFVTTQSDFSNSTGGTFPGPGTTATQSPSDERLVMVDMTRTITSSWIADLKFSLSRFVNWSISGTAVQNNFTGSDIGGLNMPFVPTTTHQNIVPTIAVSSYNSLFGNTSNAAVYNIYYFTPSFSQVKGRHMIHYGFQYLDTQDGSQGIPGNPNGSFTFNGQFTRQNPLTSSANSGLSVADLLLGYPSAGSLSWNQSNFVSYHYYGAYVQDDYKIRRNVTLNVGLRWDGYGAPVERDNRINGQFCLTCTNPYTSQMNYAQYPSLRNPLTGGWTFAGVNGQPRNPYALPKTQFEPRIGIAWSIDSKTVARAGFGRYYNYGPNDTTSNGFSNSTAYRDSLDGNITPTNYFQSGNPYPNGVIAPTGSSQGLETLAGNAVSFYGTNRSVPVTQHWSIGIQRVLPLSTVLEVAYVGSHTHGLEVSPNVDVISTAQQQACFVNSSICNNNVPNPFYGILPLTTGLGASPTVQSYELMRPYQLFNGITQTSDPAGFSNYDALQVRVERRMKNMNFIVNYTFAKWMYANSYLNNGTYIDPTLYYGLAGNDVKHSFNTTAVIPLPVGKGTHLLSNAHGVLGGVVNGWLFDPSFIINSGFPVPIPAATFSCASYQSPDGQTVQHWFNNDTSCYTDLKPYQPRTNPLYYSNLRDPGLFQMNAALQKRFELTREGMYLQVRLEALNATNTQVLAAPNTNNDNKPNCAGVPVCSGFGTISPGTSIRAGFVSMKLVF